MVGAGTNQAVDSRLIDDRWNETKGLPTRIRLLSIGRTRIAVYRFPRDAGGYQSGHIAAFAQARGRVIFAEVHGYHHADAATAMVIDLLRAE